MEKTSEVLENIATANNVRLLATNLTVTALTAQMHEKYWGGKLEGNPEQQTLLRLARSPRTYQPDLTGVNVEPHGKHCLVAQSPQDEWRAIRFSAMFAKGVEGFTEGREYAKQNAQFPESVVEQMPDGARDASYSFVVTQIKVKYNKRASDRPYTTANGKEVINAAQHEKTNKIRFASGVEVYHIPCDQGDVVLVPCAAMENVNDLHTFLETFWNDEYEIVASEGTLRFPLLPKTKTNLGISILENACIPSAAAVVAEAKGVMQLEMTLDGYESRTEASMLMIEKNAGRWEEPAFDEQIEDNYIILIALDQPSGELAFAEATYVDFDSLVAAQWPATEL